MVLCPFKTITIAHSSSHPPPSASHLMFSIGSWQPDIPPNLQLLKLAFPNGQLNLALFAFYTPEDSSVTINYCLLSYYSFALYLLTGLQDNTTARLPETTDKKYPLSAWGHPRSECRPKKICNIAVQGYSIRRDPPGKKAFTTLSHPQTCSSLGLHVTVNS